MTDHTSVGDITARWASILVAACAILTVGCSFAASAGDDGTGWTVTRLDLVVDVDTEPAELIKVAGTIEVRLDARKSDGPSFRINSQGSNIRWLALEGPDNAKTELNDRAGSATLAHLRAPAGFEKGQELGLRFELEMGKGSSQLMAREDIALASWIHAWYPHARQSGNRFTARNLSVPGTTTFHLPAGWIALSDGHLVSRQTGAHETVEVWDLGENPVARSFAAGPFHAAEREINGRSIRIYLRDTHPIGVDRLAELLVRTMTAQESRLGDFPFAGYGVVEVPNNIGGWSAASQQTFIMAKSSNFDYEHGNLPLWAHEMSHAWWGNTVGTTGPGAKMAGEALAQFGALIAIEAIEGRDAMLDFLEHSRTGYSPAQCAEGYFRLVDDGNDHALASLGSSGLSGNLTHSLVDSKGMWVYHMLRQRIGDELFFGTLRGLIAEYSGRPMSLDDIRQAFAAAAPAPDLDLRSFFAQWLDRIGGLDLDVSFSVADGSTSLVVVQSEAVQPFDLDLELDLHLADGSVRRELIEIAGRETRVQFELLPRLVRIEIDPRRKLLIRRASYDAAPDIVGVAERADWVEAESYIGAYISVDEGNPFTVTNERGNLWVRAGPGESMRLWPSVDSPHRFRVTGGWVTFALENGRAVSARVVFDGGPTMEAVRSR